MTNFITTEEEKIVAAIKKEIASLHADAQAALVREVSWIERNLLPYTVALFVFGFIWGWIF